LKTQLKIQLSTCPGEFALDRWLKLHLFKTFLNRCVQVLNLIVPRAKPTWPQSKIISNVYDRMYHAYAVEAYCGRFDDIPYQTIKSVRDKNFLRVLELSEKLLYYLGEMDRYYRQWLGLALLLAEDELEQARLATTYEGFLQSVRAQWDGFDMQGAFPKEYFQAHREGFMQILLSNSLAHIANIPWSRRKAETESKIEVKKEK
jgi:hypothetical protein